MNYNRVQDILNNKEKVDIFCDERPVWIQGVNNHIAKVGFVDKEIVPHERDNIIEMAITKEDYLLLTKL